MMRRTPLCTMAGFLVFATVVGAADRQKLRDAIALPSVNANVGVIFRPFRGFCFQGELADSGEEIAAVRKAMKGDAGDAARYDRLAALYSAANDDQRAAEATEKANAFYRERLKTHPDDAEALRGLGTNLGTVEGERLLRRAVRVAHTDWRCWAALGDYLQVAAVQALVPSGVGPQNKDVTGLFQLMVQNRPSPAAVKKALGLLDEAEKDFDQAVTFAGRDPEALSKRATARMCRGFVRTGLRSLQGGPVDFVVGMFTPEAALDFRKAAELNPSDYYALGMAALVDTFAAGSNTPPPKGSLLDVVPPDVRQRVLQSVHRLEELAQGKNKVVAAGSWEMLGLLGIMVLNDEARAERFYRQAVRLRPSRQALWAMLAAMLAEQKRYDELLALCKEAVVQHDSAANRFLLAKAYERQDRLKEAEQELREALRLEPKHFHSNLGLAALLIKHSDGGQDLAEAEKLLDRAEKALPAEGAEQQRVDLMTTRGIFLGLNGKEQKGRQLLRKALDLQKDDPVAKKVIRALND